MKHPVRVRLANPRRSLRLLGDQVQEAFERVCGSGIFLSGPESAGLEDEFAAWLGRDHGLCVSSGSAALESALYALGIGEGDAVAVTSNLDISAVTPIVRLGAELTWVDIAPGTTGMSIDSLQAGWHDRIRAVLVVHTHGYPADVGEVTRWSDAMGAAVIEDITHSPGAWLGTNRVGTFGRITIMSCAPTKPLGAVGSLGLLAADDPDLIRKSREYSSYGFETESLDALHRGEIGPWFDYVTAGINGLPDEIGAAVVRLKLPLIDSWADRRRLLAARYDQLLARFGYNQARPTGGPEGSRCAPRSFVILSPSRDHLAWVLAGRGVATSYNYVPALHHQKVFADRRPVSLPVTEQTDQEILGLPNSPENTDAEMDLVIEVLEQWLATHH